MKEYLQTSGNNAVIFLVGVASSVILMRVLGPTIVGEYALVVATYTTIVSLATFGLNNSNSVLAANESQHVDALVTHSLLVAAGIGVLPLIIYLIFRPWLDATVFTATPPGLVVIGLLLVPGTLFSTLWGALMVGMHEIALLNRLNLVGSVVSASGQAAYVALVRPDAYAVLGTTLLSAVALNAVMIVVLIRRHRWRPRVDVALLRRSLGFGLKQHAGNVAQFLFLRMDYYVVSFLLGPTALGHYSLATSLAEKIWLAIQPIYSVAFSRIAGPDREESRRTSAALTRRIIWLLTLAAIAMAVGATFLIGPVYTDRFLPAIQPLYGLLPGVICLGGSAFVALHVFGHLRRPELTSVVTWIGLVLSIPLYLGLTPRFGLFGAAAASSLTYALVFAGTVAVYVRLTGLPLGDLLLPRPADYALWRRGIVALRLRAPVPGMGDSA